MGQPQTVMATWLIGVLDQFAALGLNEDQLGEGAWLHDARGMLPTRQLQMVVIRRLWQKAAQRSGDPLLGLKVGAAMPLQAMNVVGLLVMQSPDLRTALAHTLRYQRLISNSGSFRSASMSGGLRFVYRRTACAVPMHSTQIDSVFAGYLSFVRRCAPPGVRASRVELPGGAPGLVQVNRMEYEACFGCEVILGADEPAMEFLDESLDRAFPGADPNLLRLAHRRADDMLRAQGHAESLVDHVQALLVADGGKGCDAIAEALHLSTRTLQRRLAAQGTSFRRLTEATRMNEVLRLLGNENLSLSAIARLLGYSDASAMSHAARGYWGVSPRTLRKELRR